ncbi:MAG: hypothetical protein E7G56_02290, partial [Staphylococcus epidermidis]|nr:hypothetical protein [Staphylococcus epidermidis]
LNHHESISDNYMLRPSHRDTPRKKCDWLHSIINLLLYVKHMPMLYCRQNNFFVQPMINHLKA